MELLRRLLVLQWHPKTKASFIKHFHATFDKKMKFNCLSLKLDDYELFKNGSKRPTFATI